MRRQSSEDTEKNRKGYAFSLLKDGGSFFDDDEKEIVIFRKPIDESNYFTTYINKILNILQRTPH